MLIIKYFFIIFVLFSSNSIAYLGPGIGTGAIMASLGVVVAILATILGIIFFPFIKLIKKLKNKTNDNKDNKKK